MSFFVFPVLSPISKALSRSSTRAIVSSGQNFHNSSSVPADSIMRYGDQLFGTRNTAGSSQLWACFPKLRVRSCDVTFQTAGACLPWVALDGTTKTHHRFLWNKLHYPTSLSLVGQTNHWCESRPDRVKRDKSDKTNNTRRDKFL